MDANIRNSIEMMNSDSQIDIHNMIFFIRGKQVMVDRDIANIYHVETKVLNQSVKRNIERFPEEFRFQLNDKEKNELVTDCDRFKSLKHSSALPFAFTEQGVAMLSAVLKSEIAVQVSIKIMKAFVDLRKNSFNSFNTRNRLESLENRQGMMEDRFDKVMDAFTKKKIIPKQGIFFDRQVFDAHVFARDLIKTAKRSIIIIDNYINEDTLNLMSNMKKNVRLTVYTSKLNTINELAIRRFQEQYPNTDFNIFRRSHDRFVIIDKTDIYHLGASLKDLGKKWFAFTKLDLDANMILEELRV